MIFRTLFGFNPVMNTFKHVQHVQNESISLIRTMRHHNEDASTNKPDSYITFFFPAPFSKIQCLIKKIIIKILYMSAIVHFAKNLIIFNFITVKGLTITIILTTG